MILIIRLGETSLNNINLMHFQLQATSQNKALNSSFLNQLIVWSVQMRTYVEIHILTDFASINRLTVSTYICARYF